MSGADVIDALAGLAPGSAMAAIRERKPVTRAQAQASYAALFEPAEVGSVSLQERFAVAVFVAGLHGEADIAGFYRAGLVRSGASDVLVAAVYDAVARGRTTGPYGAFPPGPLSVEDGTGPVFLAAAEGLGERLAAAVGHVHMLVFHPRDADAASLQALLNAGWSNGGIVTVSQLVAFLAFQIRTAAGLRVLAETAA